jgi:cell division protein FtsB
VARVLWRDAQGKEGSLELSGGEIQIGRSMDCAIRTDDGMVSRHHARLYWVGGQYYVEDLGSANGVFYQEQRVTRHLLKHGDAVRCGSLWLRFVAPESAQMPAFTDAAQQQQQPVDPAQARPFAQTGSPQQGGQPARPNSGTLDSPATPITGGFDMSGAGGEDVGRLKRRIEQLETELRLYRRGRGEEVAKRIDELEERSEVIRAERDKLERRVKDLEGVLQTEGSDAKAQRARLLLTRTGEIVQQLNDLLSNLRINVMAAEGEFEQFAPQIPRASFELIRESLRSSSQEVDLARDLLRELRDLAD